MDAKAEAPILWQPDVKNWLTGKDTDAGNDWRQVEKGMTENEMVGWHYWLNGFEFEQAPRAGDGQEAWHAAVHRVTKNQTRLSDWIELKLCECFVSVGVQMKMMWSSITLHRWSVACLRVCSVVSKCLWTHGLCSPPGSSINGIFQARTLSWITTSYSRGFSQPRDRTCIPCIGRCTVCRWATWEVLCISDYLTMRASFNGHDSHPAFNVEKTATVMINKGTNSNEFQVYWLWQYALLCEKSCDSSLCLVLFIETPVRVFYMFDLGINTRNFYSSDHCSDPEDHSHLVWNLGEI